MAVLKLVAKIAAVTGFIVAGTGYAFRFKIQNNVYESEVYKDALKSFHNHKKALELLGSPVKEGRVNISDEKAYGTRDNIGWITVPLYGSQRKGELRIELSMDPQSKETKKYNIYKLELKVNDMPNKVFVLKDDSASVEGAV